MPTELKGDALLDYYREAVRACYGEAAAKRAALYHSGGWYYLYGVEYGPLRRAAEVVEMADELLRRAEEAEGGD